MFEDKLRSLFFDATLLKTTSLAYVSTTVQHHDRQSQRHEKC